MTERGTDVPAVDQLWAGIRAVLKGTLVAAAVALGIRAVAGPAALPGGTLSHSGVLGLYIQLALLGAALMGALRRLWGRLPGALLAAFLGCWPLAAFAAWVTAQADAASVASDWWQSLAAGLGPAAFAAGPIGCSLYLFNRYASRRRGAAPESESGI